MTYRIELAATAKADIRSQAQWLRENVSAPAADKWLAGLYKGHRLAEDPSPPVPARGRERQIPRTYP